MPEIVCFECLTRSGIVPVSDGTRAVCLECSHKYVPCQTCGRAIDDYTGLIFHTPEPIGWCEKPECYEYDLQECDVCGRQAIPRLGMDLADGRWACDECIPAGTVEAPA